MTTNNSIITIGSIKNRLKNKGFDVENLNFGQLIRLALEKGIIKDNSISEIKEKRKKDLHDNWLKKLEEEYGKDFSSWTAKNENKIRKCVIDAGCKNETDYRNKLARRMGYKNFAERVKEWKHDTGRALPKEFNKDCSKWFGEFITQDRVMKTFEHAIPAPPNNPNFDWTCKDGKKVEHKGSCLLYEPKKTPRLKFYLDYNNIADYFVLSAWDNREYLNPIYIWIFDRDDIVRGKPFWRRESLSITDSYEGLKEFRKYEAADKLKKLKEFCDKNR